MADNKMKVARDGIEYADVDDSLSDEQKASTKQELAEQLATLERDSAATRARIKIATDALEVALKDVEETPFILSVSAHQHSPYCLSERHWWRSISNNLLTHELHCACDCVRLRITISTLSTF